jgi:hypothetical protein
VISIPPIILSIRKSGMLRMINTIILLLLELKSKITEKLMSEIEINKEIIIELESLR